MFSFSYPLSARAPFFSFPPYLFLPITRSLFYIFPRFFMLTFPSFFSLSPPPTHTPCHLTQFLAPLPLRSKSFPSTHKLFISLQAGIYGRNTLSGGDCGSAILIYALSLSCREAADFFLPATSFALFVFEVVAVLGLNRIYLNFASFSFH